MTLIVLMLEMFECCGKCLWKPTTNFNEPVPSKDNIYTCTNNTRLDLLRTIFFIKCVNVYLRNGGDHLATAKS